MTKFSREVIKALRASMLAEMQEVAKKYGLEADFGGIRFTEDNFRVKLEVRRPGVHKQAVAPVPTPTSVVTNGKVAIGAFIKHPARQHPMEIVNISARGSVIVQTNRGARYRVSMSDAQRYLIA